MLRFKTFLMERAMYADLKHNDLTKRGGDRVNVFFDKLKDGEEFLTKKGAVILPKNLLKGREDIFRSGGFRETMKGTYKGRTINVQYPLDFLKTPEFGGKGIGFGTQAEDRELAVLRKGIEAAMEKEKSGVLEMIVGKQTVIVSGVETTPGVPKSDFHLVDDKGNEVAWISHKDGTKPSDFQQYGGLSNAIFKTHPEVISFMKDVKEKYPDGMPPRTSVSRPVKDRKLANQSVWGTDFGRKRGRNNVDEFHQGPMKVVKVGTKYKITSNHYDTNGSVPTGEYSCIFFARYTGDRGANIAGIFQPNARIGVFPKGGATGTTQEI